MPSLLSLLVKTHLVLQMKVFLGHLTRSKVSFATSPLNSSIQAARHLIEGAGLCNHSTIRLKVLRQCVGRGKPN
eukprot:5085444-Pleurochrysis_carterae.AAC.1